MATLSIRHVSKRFNDTPVLNDLTLDIQSGEFFSIVGPSGCGKTTLLRMIAGFERPTEGTVILDGKDVTGVAPQFRGIGMVFQNYALFPHMTVAQNVAFGLEANGVAKGEIVERVDRILHAVGMAEKKDRPVPTLSGGEQQRVAVARALVVEPAVLLFDEPLSNLDVALRQQTREEIRSLQRTTGITTVYVTHDQAEAMSLSDRIAVMQGGSFEQVGTPQGVYEKPATPFVAKFLGDANILRGTLDPLSRRFTSGAFSVSLPSMPGLVKAERISLAIKPEAIGIDPGGGKELMGEIETSEYLGFTMHVGVRVADLTLHVIALSTPQAQQLKQGMRVGVIIDWSRCLVFKEES
jgi:ABC-type Fe3+/spermidine/putrescine transport system ATPase subunit